MDQPFRDFDDFRYRYGKANALRQPRCQQLIGEHAQMLWIVLKLYDVEVAVSAAQQLRLRSTAHFADMLHGCNGHPWDCIVRSANYPPELADCEAVYIFRKSRTLCT